MKKEMIEIIKEFDKPGCYIILTDKGMARNSDFKNFMAMFTALVREEKDELPKELFLQAVELAYSLSDDVLNDKNLEKKLKKIEKVISMLKELDKELDDE